MADAPDRRSRLQGIVPGIADRLLLDELTEQLEQTRSLLTSGPEGTAERTLERLGQPDDAEARIAVELALTESLAAPARFREAHALALHALEVFDRRGAGNVSVRRMWLLTPLVRMLVELVAEYVVKSFASDVAARMRSLYARREAQSAPGSEPRRLLTVARMEMDRLAPTYGGGGPLGTILLGATFALPALASLGNVAGAIDLGNRTLVLSGLAVIFVLFLALSGVLLRGAAVAHRRSRLIMAKPLAALWETVGNAGNPPEDDAVTVATVGIVITAVVWLVIPVVGLALYFLT